MTMHHDLNLTSLWAPLLPTTANITYSTELIKTTIPLLLCNATIVQLCGFSWFLAARLTVA